jgi:uncharacterized protein with PIN domain
VRSIPRKEEVVAAATKVLLENETIESERAFLARVLRELKRRDPAASLSGARLRKLSLRTGLVRLDIRVRIDGPTPPLDACIVCGGPLRRITNQTLGGTTAHTGYRCTQCPWWTGREFRVPTTYIFHARLARHAGSVDPAQTRFNGPPPVRSTR